MKKVKVLLSAAAVVAVIAGAIASQARNDNAIYLPNHTTPTICDVKLPGRDIVTTTNVGGIFATKVPGAPCQQVITTVVVD